MAIRVLKIILVIFVGLQGWFYVAGNVANWSSGVGAVSYVLGMEGHEVYASHIFPSITNKTLVTIAFLVIIVGEFLIGALSLKGAWDLWRVRKGDANEFNSAKRGRNGTSGLVRWLCGAWWCAFSNVANASWSRFV
jgi:predicted small integral membrane protein